VLALCEVARICAGIEMLVILRVVLRIGQIDGLRRMLVLTLWLAKSQAVRKKRYGRELISAASYPATRDSILSELT